MVQIYSRAKKVVLGLSFGLVFILILGFMYLRTDTFFPGQSDIWKEYIQTSIIFITLMLGFASVVSRDTTAPLFQVSFFKEGWKFLLSAVISFILFWILGLLVKGDALPAIATALSGVSFGVIMLYAFLVSFPEELIFRGRIADELRYRRYSRFWIYIITTLIFAAYHWAIGRSITTLIVYIPLGFLFMYVKERFSPVTHMANSGAHFSWDIFILAFFGA